MGKKVLIWPSPWNYRLNNDMFNGGYSLRGSYLRSFRLWREVAEANGFELNTWDMHDLSEADVLWFIDLPTHRSTFESARRQAPKAKTVLMICESPILGPHFFHRSNQEPFDCVVTYEKVEKDGDNKRYQYFPPLTLEEPETKIPYPDRKLLCMVNTNRVEGWFAVRQGGLTGLPVIGRLFNGWDVAASDLLFPTRGDLYSERRKLARAADEFAEDGIEFYGKGWNGEKISWCPFYVNRPYRCFKKAFVEDKIELFSGFRFTIAFENWRGSRGYIDGYKLFDGFVSGSVPVYLGEERIADYVPPEAFVDARHFASYRDLLLYLKSCPQSEWEAMREAGQAFLKSEAAKRFSDETFAERMVEILKQVTS